MLFLIYANSDSFIDRVGFGSLSGWLTLFTLIFLAIFVWRGQAGQAVGYLTETNQVLENQIVRLKERLQLAEDKIEELNKKTDISIVVEPIVRWTVLHEQSLQEHENADQLRHEQIVHAFDPMIAALKQHETRAEKRSDRLYTILEMIAAKLGSDEDFEEDLDEDRKE